MVTKQCLPNNTKYTVDKVYPLCRRNESPIAVRRRQSCTSKQNCTGELAGAEAMDLTASTMHSLSGQSSQFVLIFYSGVTVKNCHDSPEHYDVVIWHSCCCCCFFQLDYLFIYYHEQVNSTGKNVQMFVLTCAVNKHFMGNSLTPERIASISFHFYKFYKLERIPVVFGWEEVYSLDWLPANHIISHFIISHRKIGH